MQGHGVVGGGFANDARQVQWTSQGGTSATGPFVIAMNLAGGSQNISGTLAITFTGIQVALTETFPAGAFAAAGSSTCSFTSTGDGTWGGSTSDTRTAATINATMALTYDPSCVSLLGLSGTSDRNQLLLTRP
jgi:hypothetical protein